MISQNPYALVFNFVDAFAESSHQYGSVANSCLPKHVDAKLIVKQEIHIWFELMELSFSNNMYFFFILS